MRITLIVCACLFTALSLGQRWAVSEVTLSFGGSKGEIPANKPEQSHGSASIPFLLGQDFPEYVLSENIDGLHVLCQTYASVFESYDFAGRHQSAHTIKFNQ